jgi:cobalamin biosynthesis Mg chelatase CobN
MTELRMKDEQDKERPSPIRLAEIDAQQKIMARVDELMQEATQTKRSSTQDAAARPFWAQTKVDIPPSEKFGKLSQMTEDDSQKNAPQRAEEEVTAPAPPPIPQPAAQAEGGEATALSAIRDEVINKMGAAAPAMPSPELDEVLQRLDGLEGRVDKHQQDLTALLKLVRQLAAKKEEKPEPQKVKSSSSGAGLGLFVTLLLVGGMLGWLFWMDPAFMMDMMTKIINEGLTMTIQLLASFGVV